jgi:AbrB family looped-hinge helix DNA binding protein
MQTTKLSSKGQVIIPKSVRAARGWEAGQALVVIDCADGVLLKPAAPFPETLIEEVGGCLRFKGEAKSLKDMEDAIRRGALEASRGDG